MSNGGNPYSNPLFQVLGISQQDAKTVSNIASVITSVASVFSAINAAINVLTFLGVLSSADVVGEIEQAIDQLWQEFQGAVAALDTEDSMKDVQNQVAQSQTELTNLTEFAPNDAATVGIDSTWDELRPFVLNNSLSPVLTLGQPAYWQRVYLPDLVYNGNQNGNQVIPEDLALYLFSPTTAGGLVFDYRLTLPAYLEAIAIRLTILVAVVPDYQNTARPELQNMAATLESYYLQIRDGSSEAFSVDQNLPVYPTSMDFYLNARGGGLVTLSPPSAIWETGTNFYSVPDWIGNGAPYGTVEVYSAYNNVTSWPEGEFPLVEFPTSEPLASETPDVQWINFLVRYTVRSWVSWKDVYNGIGLGPVPSVIVQLKQLAGVLPATVDGPDGNYSIRELVGVWLNHFADGQIGGYALPDLDNQDGNLSMGKVLALLQTYSPEPYTSFRAALAQ